MIANIRVWIQWVSNFALLKTSNVINRTSMYDDWMFDAFVSGKLHNSLTYEIFESIFRHFHLIKSRLKISIIFLKFVDSFDDMQRSWCRKLLLEWFKKLVFNVEKLFWWWKLFIEYLFLTIVFVRFFCANSIKKTFLSKEFWSFEVFSL